MTSTYLSLYLLSWPVIVAAVLAVIVRAFAKEYRAARQSGRPMM